MHLGLTPLISQPSELRTIKSLFGDYHGPQEFLTQVKVQQLITSFSSMLWPNTNGLLIDVALVQTIDEKLDEIRREGGIIPDVVDPSEYNVFFFSARRTLPTWWLTPEVEVSIQPVNFRFNGQPAGRVRPIYLGTRLTPWRGGGTSIVVTTQHEIGPNGFNYFAVAFQLDGRSRPEGRLQLFVGGSPGGGLHVSPNVGALRDGFALGVRMAFGA